MRAIYQNGQGLMVFVPPTESETAVAIIAIVIERLEERGIATEQFEDIINCIINDRSKIQ